MEWKRVEWVRIKGGMGEKRKVGDSVGMGRRRMLKLNWGRNGFKC